MIISVCINEPNKENAFDKGRISKLKWQILKAKSSYRFKRIYFGFLWVCVHVSVCVLPLAFPLRSINMFFCCQEKNHIFIISDVNSCGSKTKMDSKMSKCIRLTWSESVTSMRANVFFFNTWLWMYINFNIWLQLIGFVYQSWVSSFKFE